MLQQTTDRVAQAQSVDTPAFLGRGMFVAGVAIGIAPAVGAAGLLLDSRMMALGVTSCLLVTAFLTAALSSGD
jgi:hypothetical protein